MNLKTLKDALVAACQPLGIAVNHYTAIKKPDRYVVWAEDSQPDGLWSDGMLEDWSIQGTIHYFTRAEKDSAVAEIPVVLGSAGIPHRLNSVQYEDETGYIHYEWVFEVFGDGTEV